jgi:4-amino-4-deoxy-L-arabinose transferase-like glycosyltransferase
VSAGTVQGFEWLGPNPATMPLFMALVTANVLAFGTLAPLTYVLLQGALDAGTCVLVHGIARSFDERYALPAAIAALLNPTQIVLAGLLYTDTPFVFCVALFLYASLQWLRDPTWRWALLIGLAVGAAALIRVFAVVWLPVLAGYLLLALALQRRLSLPAFGQLAAAGIVVALCISPVLWRNVTHYGSWQLTTQGGEHLARYVVPLVREAQDGTVWAQGVEDVERSLELRFGTLADNPFERSRQFSEVGREELRRLGLAAVVKAWLLGAALNLGTPGIILSPLVSQLPRTGFYDTPGDSSLGKIRNFLFRPDNATYAWVLLIGIAGLALARAVQLAGLVTLVWQRQNLYALVLLGLWAGFVLVINGPIASPKYRLPLEPLFAVLMGVGVVTLYRWWLGRTAR